VRERLPQQIVGITGLAHHLDPGVLQQPADAGSKEHIVFSDHDADLAQHEQR
jgi:hypothetical protein